MGEEERRRRLARIIEGARRSKTSHVYPRDILERARGVLFAYKAKKDGVRERGRELHLFSPPCSKQKRDDLCGAGAAAPRRGRILAFSSAPSRVVGVAECAIAFALLLSPALSFSLFLLSNIGTRTAMRLSRMTCNYRPSFFFPFLFFFLFPGPLAERFRGRAG